MSNRGIPQLRMAKYALIQIPNSVSDGTGTAELASSVLKTSPPLPVTGFTACIETANSCDTARVSQGVGPVTATPGSDMFLS